MFAALAALGHGFLSAPQLRIARRLTSSVLQCPQWLTTRRQAADAEGEDETVAQADATTEEADADVTEAADATTAEAEETEEEAPEVDPNAELKAEIAEMRAAHQQTLAQQAAKELEAMEMAGGGGGGDEEGTRAP